MSLSIRQSFVEQFSFNGKNVRAVYIQDVGECLVACDVYTAIGYNKKGGVKALQRLVSDKYKMRLRPPPSRHSFAERSRRIRDCYEVEKTASIRTC